jgi:LysR family transcriptional regulator, cyn operon transcriptional activator
MDIETRQLRVLLTIAEAGSISQAATRLYISQPALSQQLKALEAAFGAILFTRSRRGVALTPAGALVVRHARQIIYELDAAQGALRALAGLERGTLTIGATLTVSMCLMPQALARFSQRYSGIALRVAEMSVDAIEPSLLTGATDLGIGSVPALHEGVLGMPLFTEAYLVIAAPGHPLAERAQVRFAELAQHPMVLLDRSFGTRRLWEFHCQQAGVRPPVLVELNAVGGVLEAVHALGALTFLPAMALLGKHAVGLRGVALSDPAPWRTVGVLTRQQVYANPAVAAFTSVVRALLAELELPYMRVAPA